MPNTGSVYDQIQRDREARQEARDRDAAQARSNADRLREGISANDAANLTPEARLARAKALSGGDFDQMQGAACVAHFAAAAEQMMQRAKYCGLAADFIESLAQETSPVEPFDEALVYRRTFESIRIVISPDDPTWRTSGDSISPRCRLPLREQLAQDVAYKDCARVFVCGLRALRAASAYARLRPEMSCHDAALAGLKIWPVPQRAP